MEQELISIIIPVYNVEKYLSKCIQSIIDQTYKNLEIILVDDGSPDQSGEICDQFAKIDQRIVVIHKGNGGLSDARNTGIKVSRGGYVAFVDSDDLVVPTYVSELYQGIKDCEADLSVCEFQMFTDEDSLRNDYEIGIDEDYDVISGIDAMRMISLDGNRRLVVAWTKLYRKELFNNLLFETGKIHEDEFLVHRLLNKIDSICLINKRLYFYRNNTSGIINSPFSKKKLDAIDARKDRIQLLRTIGGFDDCIEAEQLAIVYCLIRLYFEAKSSGECKPTTRELKEMFSRELENINWKKLRVKDGIWIRLFQANPTVYKFVYGFNLIISKYMK